MALVLLATSKPWNVRRAAEEVGDAIYPQDPGLRVEVDERYPLIYVFSRLHPMRVFRLVVAEPPAYVERAVPVTSLLHVKLNGCDEAVGYIVDAVLPLVEGWRTSFSVEVRPRGYHVTGCEAKQATNAVIEELRGRGLSVSRRGNGFVRVEDTYYGVVLSAVREGSDRIGFWRARRLGVHG